MAEPKRYPPIGPFRSDQLRSGDPYELSRGHAIFCLPTGARGGKANLLGGSVLASDPAVQDAGIDVGFSPEPGTLRAPDVSVGVIPNAAGWAPGVPVLALEYADRGQDEGELAAKIAELLEHGTKLVWVVRLVGEPIVEIHAPDQPMHTASYEDTLTAPGILARPVPVRALVEREAGLTATFDNLLARFGYPTAGAIREQGREEGREEGRHRGRLDALIDLIEDRFGTIAPAHVAALRSLQPSELRAWQSRALHVSSVDELFAGSR